MVKKILLYTFISLCFIVLLALFMTNAVQLSDTQAELASTQNELTITQANLALNQANLGILEAKLSQTQSDLAKTQAELSATESELETTTEKLRETSSQLTQTETEYTETLTALNKEKELSIELQSSLDNLEANYNSFTAGYGYVTKDPTYKEMKAFLTADITDSFDYVKNEFVCHDFGAEVTGNAREQRIRCAYVLIDYIDDDTPGHAIIAFNTTDKGLIYIEPQSDEEVNLRVGYHYWSSIKAKPGYYYTEPDYDDTVEDILALW